MASVTGMPARLRYYRQKAGLRQRDLAERAGLTLTRVSLLETNAGEWRKLRPDNVKALADALGVTVADLQGTTPAVEAAAAGDNGQVASDALSSARPVRVAQRPTSLEWDIRRPLAPGADRPRPDHQGERWDAQGACLMEHLRRAYIEWVDDLDYDPANPDVGELLDRFDDATQRWARRHGMMVPRDAERAYAAPDDPVWVLADDGARIEGRSTAKMMRPEWRTEYVVPAPDDAPEELRRSGRMDVVRDADGRLYAVPCAHETPQNDPGLHEWAPDRDARQGALGRGRTGGEPESDEEEGRGWLW